MKHFSNFSRRLLLAAACCATMTPQLARAAGTKAATPSVVALSGDQKILHALNRFAFGPRPGDLERVRQMGLGRWLEEQLSPEAIDDSAVEAKVARLATLKYSNEQLMLAYVADTSAAIKALAGGPQGQGGKKAANLSDDQLTQIRQALNDSQKELLQRVQSGELPLRTSIQAVGELQADKITRAVESNRQLQEVLVDFWSNHFNLDVKKGPVRALKIVDEREVIRPHVLGRFREMLEASAKSPAMMFYLDNARSTRDYDMGTMPVRPVRAKNGQKKRIKGLVKGVTPDMMPEADAMPALAPAATPRRRGGLNENYGRELMELHTLGVDGGYTQKDVTEVARCFTGWSIDRQTGRFIFRPRAHDDGEKTVLGHTIPAGGGIQDGETVLDLLASSPATAHHIARKLCIRFVADEPPAALVERVAQKFLDSGGDLKAVMRVIAYAPETFTSATYRSKIKSPFEFAVSSVRALGASIELPDPQRPIGRIQLIADGQAVSNRGGGGGGGGGGRRRRDSLAREIAAMGQPLYSYQAPTGYSEDSRDWVSSGALIARLNFALALTGGQIADATVDSTDLLKGVPAEDHEAVLDRLAQRLASNDLSSATRLTLQNQMPPGTPPDAAKLAALVLGSPEFQRK